MNTSMKNIFLFVFILFTCCSIIRKKQSNNGEALFYTNGVYNAYSDTLCSDISYQIHNDTVAENYFSLVVYQVKGRWAKVSAYSPDTSFKERAWINLSKIGVKVIEYPVLYEEPNKSSSKIKIVGYNYQYLKILNYKNGWFKVQYTNGNKVYTGWLPPDNQCGNPYTSCC